MPNHQAVRDAVQRLSPKSEFATPNPFELTRAALARVYLRGQLYRQAVRELGELVGVDPQRYDLRAALVEALERGGLYDAAGVAAQSLLVELPYCLKANLVLGRVWLNTAKDDDARALLQRAQMLDPENRVAHSLFGTRSPLPPRIPRLPLQESDTEPIELPYLVDDEEIVAESVIIDAQSEPVETQQTEDRTDRTRDTFEPPPEWRPPAPPERQPAIESRESPTLQELTVATGASQDVLKETSVPDIPQKMSLIDVQKQYLLDHSDDHQARLDLARHLRDIGALDQALREYRILVEASYEVLPGVVHDLELLARLHPETQAIDDVLCSAHEREKRVPPPSDA